MHLTMSRSIGKHVQLQTLDWLNKNLPSSCIPKNDGKGKQKHVKTNGNKGKQV